MKTLQVSQRGQQTIASPIRKFLPLLKDAQSRGVKVYKLNSGDPDLEMPAEFLNAIKKYPHKTLNYAPSSGMPEHVAAWRQYYEQFGVRLEANQVIPTAGCAEAIVFALQAVADIGDEVIVFEPVYVSYKSYATITGIKLVPVTLREGNNFALPKSSEVEKRITEKTKAIVVVNPDNPTGKLWSAKELKTILQIAEKHNLFVISDETYREIRFSGKATCLLSEKEYGDRVIVIDSVSKRFSMPGARIGCIASFNVHVMSAVLKFAQARLSAGSLEQWGLIPLLKKSRAYTNTVQKEYLKRRDVVYRGLKAIPGVKCHEPQGAFYAVARLPAKDSEGFVKFMLTDFEYQKETVLVTPMKEFYISPGLGQNEIRIAYVLNAKDLKRCMEILKRGLEEYQRRMK